MVNDKLKKLIFYRLFEDLKKIEVIPYDDSVWFIDRENEYWYFEYVKTGILYYRYTYFDSFFRLFSMEPKEYQWVISEWVEEVLNCKVKTPTEYVDNVSTRIKRVLNYEVKTP